MAAVTRPPPTTALSAKVVPAPRGSFTGFLQAVKDGDRRTLNLVYGSDYESTPWTVAKAALNESSGTGGGYIVPQEYSLQLLEAIAEDSFIWPRANIIPMERAEIQVPRIDVETAPTVAGVSPFFAGIQFKWGSEQSPQETEPRFRQMSLKAWDLLGYAVLSNQFLADTGPAGEEHLVRLFGQAAAWYAEFAFLRGTGSAQQMPLGILNSPALIQVSRNTASQIKSTDVAAMSAKLLPFSWGRAIWATHPTCMAQIGAMAGYTVNMWHSGERSNPAGFLLNMPLYITEKLPALGTPGDLLLFDPGLYTVGLRQQVLVDVSSQAGSLFASYQTAFRIWLRCDGRGQVSGPITLQDTSSTVSPYIALQ